MVIVLRSSRANAFDKMITTWIGLGALATMGAGFNGLSFLDYNKNDSSFIMTILALAAVWCFVIVILLSTESAPSANEATTPSLTLEADYSSAESVRPWVTLRSKRASSRCSLAVSVLTATRSC